MIKMRLPRILKPWYCADLIRLGKNHDGGYLVSTADVKKSDWLLSLGVGEDTSFEQSFYDMNPCAIDAYDGSLISCPTFFSGNKIFHPANVGYRSHHVHLADVVATYQKQIFFKCDIEGDEYQILDDLICNSHKFSGLVMEFHDVHKPLLWQELCNFISKIPQKLVHVHINNNSYLQTDQDLYYPICVELTFSSHGSCEWCDVQLPHALDQPNSVQRPDFQIVF